MAKPPVTKDIDSTSPVLSTKSSPPRSETSVPETKRDAPNVEQKPLGAPPRPQPSSDYFSATHAPPASHLNLEPNPFDQSFGGRETPGGTKLPPLSALASPQPLLTGGQGQSTPGFWANSLRTGPLSPAMLSGPTGGDYFSDNHHLRGGFPTPNESSLRTGLTPGGGGSMFPVASPNSQALFDHMTNGGATPGTLEFHRTAMTAAANAKRESQNLNITSQPQDSPLNGHLNKSSNSDIFGQHDANDAANGLFMLASQSASQPRSGSQAGNQYVMAQPQPVHAHPNQNDTSPVTAPRNGNASMSTASGRGMSEVSVKSEDSEQASRPNTRGKGSKKVPANGRRKADDTPSKQPAAKKAKNGHVSSAMSLMEPEPQSEEELDMSKEDEYNANGKKLTDEEKRKNFLERNRIAALKCRQRKKQWLANLQQKVELFTQENDSLTHQLNAARDELVQLRTILSAHKECNVSQQAGLAGMQMNHVMDYGNHMANPYGMAMNGQQVMAGQAAAGGRRFS